MRRPHGKASSSQFKSKILIMTIDNPSSPVLQTSLQGNSMLDSQSLLPLTSQLDQRMDPSSMAMEDYGAEADDLQNNDNRNALPHRQVARILDRAGLRVAEEFQKFLLEYQIEGHSVYRSKIIELEVSQQTTLWTSFPDLLAFNSGLARAIQSDYVHFEPFLVKALVRCIEIIAPTYLKEGNALRDFFIAFADNDAIQKIRQLKTELCGKLISFKATITRTSIVRPELIEATFQCEDCDEVIVGIHQQYVFTRVSSQGKLSNFLSYVAPTMPKRTL
eukprot:Partr_v1_DN28772_c3_g2_i2_m61892 putative dna replication licensing factor